MLDMTTNSTRLHPFEWRVLRVTSSGVCRFSCFSGWRRASSNCEWVPLLVLAQRGTGSFTPRCRDIFPFRFMVSAFAVCILIMRTKIKAEVSTTKPLPVISIAKSALFVLMAWVPTSYRGLYTACSFTGVGSLLTRFFGVLHHTPGTKP